MQKLGGFLTFLNRRPSLRGYQVLDRVSRSKKFDTYRAIERTSAVEMVLIVSRTGFSSAAELAGILLEQMPSAKAQRLRDGQLGFIAEPLDLLEVNSAHPSQRPKKYRKGAPRSLLLVSACVVAIFCLSGFLLTNSTKQVDESSSLAKAAPTLIQNDIPAATNSAEACRQLLSTAEPQIGAFAEGSSDSGSSALTLEEILRLRIGGLQSVQVRISCNQGGESKIESPLSETWRVTLSLSEDRWIVKKMTRLEN